MLLSTRLCHFWMLDKKTKERQGLSFTHDHHSPLLHMLIDRWLKLVFWRNFPQVGAAAANVGRCITLHFREQITVEKGTCSCMHKTAHTRETPFLSWIHRCSRCNEFPRLLWWQKTINAFAALHFFYILSHLIIEANASRLLFSSSYERHRFRVVFVFNKFVSIPDRRIFAWFLLQKNGCISG